MNPILSRFLASGVLLIWGVVLIFFYASGTIASYLHPTFHIYTLLSGSVLVLLALVLLFTFPSEHHACGCAGHCHAGSPFGGGVLSLLVLTVPLLMATKFSPGTFGATAVRNRGIVENATDLPGYSPAGSKENVSLAEGTMMDPDLYLKKNATGQIVAETVDLLFAASDPVMREDFENKEVEVLGQLLPARTGNPEGDRFNLVRLFVICCAADARSVGIAVQTKTPLDLPEMTWVKVRGKATFPLEGGRRIPLVLASSVTETEPPSDSFLY
jgi:uncharacterized repeat protein (TIGR03943 family)